MRLHTNDYSIQHRTLTFVDDSPDGGCIVQCPCGAIFNENPPDATGLPATKREGLSNCPKCDSDLIYPGWASW